jgi:hypothetical protein
VIGKPLTPYQRNAYVDSADHWKRRVLLNTDPVDRERAEAAILTARRLFQPHGRKPTFHWFDTPIECMAFIATTTGEALTRKDFLTDKLTSFFRWSDSDVTLHGIVRKLFNHIPTSFKARSTDSFIYESTHLRQDKKVHLRQPDEIFKSEMGQFAWDIHKYHFAKERLGLNVNVEMSTKIEAAVEIARSCCLWWNHQDVVVMSERPTVIALDDSDNLHSVSGPAFCYGDKLRKYMIHGIEVEPQIVKDPDNYLTPARIEQEHNAEVRRTLLDLYGSERYLRQTGAQVIHEGRHGRRLWWRMPNENRRVARGMEADSIFTNSNEPLVMVEVKNSTPEPDGSIKIYFLRVAPHIRNADEAVAWTFGLTLAEYEPYVET